MARRKWKFCAEADGVSGYLDPIGMIVKDKSGVEDFIGLDNEADKEADRRADAYEERTGLFCNRITYESQGKVEKKNGDLFKP